MWPETPTPSFQHMLPVRHKMKPFMVTTNVSSVFSTLWIHLHAVYVSIFVCPTEVKQSNKSTLRAPYKFGDFRIKRCSCSPNDTHFHSIKKRKPLLQNPEKKSTTHSHHPRPQKRGSELFFFSLCRTSILLLGVWVQLHGLSVWWAEHVCKGNNIQQDCTQGPQGDLEFMVKPGQSVRICHMWDMRQTSGTTRPLNRHN